MTPKVYKPSLQKKKNEILKMRIWDSDNIYDVLCIDIAIDGIGR